MATMKLDSRKEDILAYIIRDFVDTAKPVSSGRVAKRGGADVSSATIRNTMLELDEEGFLFQPYISAGRAPTEKGYRYFVDNLMELKSPEMVLKQRIDRIVENINKEMDETFEELSRTMAFSLKLFSGIGFLDEEEKIFGRGLSEVLKEPEFEERGLASEFASFVENMEEDLRDLDIGLQNMDNNPNININSFGIVSLFFNDDKFGRCVMFSAGPKRMNYEKAVSLLKYTAKDITKKNKNKYGRK